MKDHSSDESNDIENQTIPLSTRDLVDRELIPIIDEMPTEDIDNQNVHAFRERMATPLPEPLPLGVEATWLTVPGAGKQPEVRIRLIRPVAATAPYPVMVHIHGGGHVAGTPLRRNVCNAGLALAVNCAVASIEYRLAPETPFPGGLSDCYAALQWLYANAETLHLDPQCFAVGGESAGAGMAAALAMLARDRGRVPIRFQLLIYPMLDDRTCTDGGRNRYTGEYVWTRQSNLFGWRSYLGAEPGSHGISPYAAPARASNLQGLPPAFIASGSLDLFVDEDIDYAQRLLNAGVSVELHIYPGAFHGFDYAASAITHQFGRDVENALRRAFTRPA